jgi:uncharacterized protein (DUF433 family)
MEPTTLENRISIDPEIHHGKPCVTGTRIPVEFVLELVRDGVSFADIVENYYPDLHLEDIRACIQYAIAIVAVEEINLSPPTP